MLLIGAVFVYVSLSFILPRLVTGGPFPVKRGVTLWLVAILLGVILAALGIAAIGGGLVFLTGAAGGPGRMRSLQTDDAA
jgi:hypothetical protein